MNLTLDLAHAHTNDILDYFYSLSAPKADEMNGEYSATLLDQGNAIYNQINQVLTSQNPILGAWKGKALCCKHGKGHGYNIFQKGDRVKRLFRMDLAMAPSRYDGQPMLQLDYQPYASLLGKIHMVDEIRKISEGQYLGIGTWGFSPKQRMLPLPFLLEGPTYRFIGPDSNETSFLSALKSLIK